MVRVGILIHVSSKSPRLDPPFPHLPKTDIQNTIYKLTEKRQSCTGLFVHMILINNVFHSNCFFISNCGCFTVQISLKNVQH